MKKRAKEKGSKPGAIWHVFNARDADKIRDFLNKVNNVKFLRFNVISTKLIFAFPYF